MRKHKLLKLNFLLICLAASCFSAAAQIAIKDGAISINNNLNTAASLRGLSVVNSNIVWASGTGGTVIKTTDGGAAWKVMAVPGAEKLDFRDIEAFDTHTAYILSIGNGDSSRIYKTTDGGTTWKLQYQNTNPKAFFDALACWDAKNCIAMSDPVDGKYLLFKTTDGETWKQMDTDKMPNAKDGEAAFAASGTCLITQGKNNAFIVSGGKAARVFRSTNRGLSWLVSDTPIVSGTAGSGIFSIAMRDAKNGVIVGGNYEKPNEAGSNLAFTSDGGKTWVAGKGLTGYRSGVAYLNKKTIVAVGTTGSDILHDDGKSWENGKSRFSYNGGKIWPGKNGENIENFNSVKVIKDGNGLAIWAVGAKGLVFKQHYPIIYKIGINSL